MGGRPGRGRHRLCGAVNGTVVYRDDGRRGRRCGDFSNLFPQPPGADLLPPPPPPPPHRRLRLCLIRPSVLFRNVAHTAMWRARDGDGDGGRRDGGGGILCMNGFYHITCFAQPLPEPRPTRPDSSWIDETTPPRRERGPFRNFKRIFGVAYCGTAC